MSLSIFTPVDNSTLEVSSDWFGDRTFAGKWRAVTLAAGTHVLVQNLSCNPVFCSFTAPATEADLKLGLPFVAGTPSIIFPRGAATLYVSFPYGDSAALVTVGTATNPA